MPPSARSHIRALTFNHSCPLGWVVVDTQTTPEAGTGEQIYTCCPIDWVLSNDKCLSPEPTILYPHPQVHDDSETHLSPPDDLHNGAAENPLGESDFPDPTSNLATGGGASTTPFIHGHITIPTRCSHSSSHMRARDVDSSDSSTGGGLSTGAKAAIGVTIPVAVIVISVLVFIVFRARVKAKSRQAGGSSPDDTGISDLLPPELRNGSKNKEVVELNKAAVADHRPPNKADEQELLAAISAGNGRGRLQGQAWEKKR